MNWWKALVDLSMSKESLMNSSLSEGFEKTKPVGSGGRSAFALPICMLSKLKCIIKNISL